jgi:hypothetical protein|nr:hypothetical protein [Curvibacter delicatus]
MIWDKTDSSVISLIMFLSSLSIHTSQCHVNAAYRMSDSATHQQITAALAEEKGKTRDRERERLLLRRQSPPKQLVEYSASSQTVQHLVRQLSRARWNDQVHGLRRVFYGTQRNTLRHGQPLGLEHSNWIGQQAGLESGIRPAAGDDTAQCLLMCILIFGHHFSF